jgi:site-specific recombinase XerD
LNQFITWYGNGDVRSVTSEDIRRYLASLTDRGLTPHTVKRHHTILSAFYTWLCSPDIRLADVHPVRVVPAPRLPKLKPKALSHAEVKSLLGATSRSRHKRRDRAIIRFLLDTGARASELCGARLGDVDLHTGRIRVLGKGSKERFTYLGRRARSDLWLYVREERPEPAQVDGDFLFLSEEGYGLDRHSLRLIVYRLAKKAGVKASPHMFRHTAAIERLRNGMDLLSLQRFLGHEQLQTTQVYLTALSDDDVQERARRTSPGDNWRL